MGYSLANFDLFLGHNLEIRTGGPIGPEASYRLGFWSRVWILGVQVEYLNEVEPKPLGRDPEHTNVRSD